MNDTHGSQGEGWVGFDLDGTLAKYDGWKGIDHIGEPVRPMVALIKKMHAEGRRVKVLTARVSPHKLEDGTTGESYITVPGKDGGSTRQYARQYVADWCHFNLGFVPEITHEKDHLMLELYDDRVKQVVPNEGRLVEDIAASKRVVHELTTVEYVSCKWGDRITAFCLGSLVGVVLYVAAALWGAKSMPEAAQDLDRAARGYHDAYMKGLLR